MIPHIEWYQDHYSGMMLPTSVLEYDERFKKLINKLKTEHTKEQYMTKNKNTLDELIKEEYKPKESIYNGRYTKTALFLMRMIDLNLQHPFMQKYLSNAFLDDKGIKHIYCRPIFLLFKTKDYQEKEFVAMCKVLNELPYKVHDYDLGKQDGQYLVMMVFETPEKYKTDYYHFKAGRYSRISKEYKSLFPKEIEVAKGKQESLVWGILHKSAKIKEKVANIMCVMEDDGKTPKNAQDYREFKEFLETLDELYDLPHKKEEYFRIGDAELDKELIL